MEMWNAVLAALGVLALLVLACWVSVWWQRKGFGKDFDERQLQAQGQARLFSDAVSFAYFLPLALWLWYASRKGIATMEPYLLVIFGLLLNATAFHIYCIMTYAALPLGKRPGVAAAWFALMGVVQLAYFFCDGSGSVPVTGPDSFLWVNLSFGVACLSLAAAHLISLLRKEKE